MRLKQFSPKKIHHQINYSYYAGMRMMMRRKGIRYERYVLEFKNNERKILIKFIILIITRPSESRTRIWRAK